MLDNLPQELLTKIFNLLPVLDLLSLSITCCAFNDAINSSSELMSKFTVFLFDSNKTLEWAPMRRYSSVFVCCKNLCDFESIFEDIGGDLRKLHLSYYTVDADVLLRILKLCKDLKELHLQAVQVQTQAGYQEIPLPELNLEKFWILSIYESSELIFQLLGNSSVVNLEMLGNFRHAQLLKNFLRTQKKLKSFKIHNECDEFMLFDDNVLAECDFELRELELNNWDMFNHLTPFFTNFMERHKHTLEVFASNNTKAFNFLPHCSVLKSVTLPSMNFTNPNVYATVENVTIEIGTIDNWSGCFPNVKNVKITQQCSSDTQALRETENCSKLESLEVNFGKIYELNLPRLKILKLKFFDLCEKIPLMKENLKCLEELTLDGFGNCKWLIELLENEDVRLKVLRVKKLKLSDEVKEFLAKNVGKIKSVEILAM